MKVLDIISERKISELKAPKVIRLTDPKTMEAYKRLLRAKAAKQTAKSKAIDAAWRKGYPTKWLWIIRIIGVIDAFAALYLDLAYAEADYNAGKLSQDDLQKYRQWAFGVFEVEIAGIVAVALANTLIVAKLAKWIVRILSAGTAGVTMGASIAGLVASEAFFQWITWWFTTGPARDWFSGVLRRLAELGGQLPESIWSEIVGYYKQGHPGDKAKDKVEPGPAGQKPGEKPAQDLNVGAGTKPAPGVDPVWGTPAPAVPKSQYMGLSPFTPVSSTGAAPTAQRPVR